VTSSKLEVDISFVNSIAFLMKGGPRLHSILCICYTSILLMTIRKTKTSLERADKHTHALAARVFPCQGLTNPMKRGRYHRNPLDLGIQFASYRPAKDHYLSFTRNEFLRCKDSCIFQVGALVLLRNSSKASLIELGESVLESKLRWSYASRILLIFD
jgi:hypothetical protein